MTNNQLLSMAKEANRKANYYLDQQAKHPCFSPRHIDASNRAQQYLDSLDTVVKQAFHTMPTEEYRTFINSIA